MNYRHIYHAGSFADVFKHVLLITLIRSLATKEKPFCYLETHAGIGNYDLYSEAAQKTHEADFGILKLWDLFQQQTACRAMPEPIADYLQQVKDWNKHQQTGAPLRFYPGSPALARSCLRAQDRMVITELHPEDYAALKKLFAKDKQVAIHHLDGYLGMKAFLPPREMRGLTLIDPPFESTAEFKLILQHLTSAIRHFPGGVYAIWYPIKSLTEVTQFYRQLQLSGIRKILYCEFYMSEIKADALNACGLVIINPPWRWEQTATDVLSWLALNLANSPGKYSVKWLVPE